MLLLANAYGNFIRSSTWMSQVLVWIQLQGIIYGMLLSVRNKAGLLFSPVLSLTHSLNLSPLYTHTTEPLPTKALILYGFTYQFRMFLQLLCWQQMQIIFPSISLIRIVFIFSAHSMEEAEALCDRLGIFVDGSLQCIGNPKEVNLTYFAMKISRASFSHSSFLHGT